MKITELRIKRKSLAAEARIIKSEEQKVLGKARDRAGVWSRADTVKLRKALIRDGVTDRREQDHAIASIRSFANIEVEKLPADRLYGTYHALRHHRVTVVRDAARAAHLAHAYLKGTPYAKVEQPKYDWPAQITNLASAVLADVRRFGGNRAGADHKAILAWMGGKPAHWQIAEAVKMAEPA